MYYLTLYCIDFSLFIFLFVLKKKDVKKYVKGFVCVCVCVCVISRLCRWLFLDYGVGRLVGLEDFIMVTETQNEYLGCGFGVGRGKA